MVGGAANTVAKTISAYDMTFSDAIYGACGRYVSRARLDSMLTHEYGLLIERLDAQVGGVRTFFAFADTVAARSFRGHAESHGWMGLRFQTAPRGELNEIIIHIRMLDPSNLQQREALGIVGVNLIYGAFFLTKNPEALVGSLVDDLGAGRIEIDMIRFSRPDFADVDDRIMALQLVTHNLTKAALFRADGEIVNAKRRALQEAFACRAWKFSPGHTGCRRHAPIVPAPCSCARKPSRTPSRRFSWRSPCRISWRAGSLLRDFLDRVDMLGAMGRTVLISNYGRLLPPGRFSCALYR